MFFFFKQKTAYELRISDWSSDVALPILLQRPDDLVGPDRREAGRLRGRRLAAAQFLGGDQSLLDQQGLKAVQPLLVVGVAEILHRRLLLAGGPPLVDGPLPQAAAGQGQGEGALPPLDVAMRERERVVSGKRVSARVNLGGLRTLKKNTNQK